MCARASEGPKNRSGKAVGNCRQPWARLLESKFRFDLAPKVPGREQTKLKNGHLVGRTSVQSKILR